MLRWVIAALAIRTQVYTEVWSEETGRNTSTSTLYLTDDFELKEVAVETSGQHIASVRGGFTKFTIKFLLAQLSFHIRLVKANKALKLR